MSEQPLPTADRVITFLKGQHEEVKEVMPEVLNASGEDRLRAFGRVRRMLALHETIERCAVHPTALATDAQYVVETRLREEDRATAAITALEEMDLDSEGFEQAYRALMSDVLEHAEREEHEEFIHVGTFASERLALIARGMTIAEQGAQSLGGTTFEEMLSNASMALRQT